MDGSDRTAEDLLTHLGWLRALARGILDDRDDADDVAQEAWLTATTRAPQNPDAMRGWLRRIVHNLAFMRSRSGRRRARRELVSQYGGATQADSAELLLDQARMHHLLASLVLGLTEPYRSTVLLHFYEGLSAAEIARRDGIPASTVRWRLSQALAQLRRGLDGEAQGDRRRWALALAPIADKAAPAKAATAGGAWAMKLGLKVALVALLLVLIAGVTRVVQHGSLTPGRNDSTGHSAGSWGAWWRGGADTKEPSWLVQRGAPRRRVAGTVLFHEAPARGATVQLFNQFVYAGGSPPPTRVTDESGRFDFGPQAATFITLMATAPGRSSDIAGVEVANPAARPAPDQIEMRLGDCAAPLDGVVHDASGGPIAGASVCYGIDGGMPSSCMKSDASGRYELCMNPAGSMSVRVAAQGYGAVLEEVPGHWSRLTRNFALTPEAVVRGTVVRASDGKPQAGAWVGMRSATSWMLGPAPNGTLTDENGRFSIAEVAAGRHRLSAQTDSGTTLQDLDVDVRTGSTVEGVLLRVADLPTIRGTVRENGRPVSGVALALQSTTVNELYSPQVFSQPDGSFVLERAPRGPSSLQSQNHQVVAPTVLRVDKDMEGVRIDVAPQTIVHGHVRRAGKPVGDVWVEAGNILPVSDRSNVDGEFRLIGLPPGTHTLRAATPTANGRGKVTLARGETVGIDIDLDAAASISGVLVEEDGQPASGLFVSFSQVQGADEAGVTTGDDGTFQVGPLVGTGAYRASVKQSERLPIALPAATAAFPEVVLRDGSSHVDGIRLVVRRGHHIVSGKVVGADGTPQPDAELVLVKREADKPLRFAEGRQTARVLAGLDGSFKIGDLEAGDYGLRARLGAGPEVILEHVAADADALVLKLPPSGTIVGKLVGFASPPEVLAQRMGLAPSLHASITAEGFTLRELAAGTYVISTAAGESDVTQVEVSGGAVVSATLTRRAGGLLRGRVVDARDGKPAPGMTCNPSVGGSLDGRLLLAGASITDDDGRFELAVPSGRVEVRCYGDYITVSTGVVVVDVEEHQTVDAEVRVVHRRSMHVGDKVGSWTGATPERALFGFRVQSVKPGSPADRAGLKSGDQLASVEGLSLDRLCLDGIRTLLDDRPLGAPFPVQVARGATTIGVSLTLVPMSQ